MSTPQYSDFQYYTGTKLGSPWVTSQFHQIVDYLTNGNYDFTIGALTCKAITGVGAVGITGTVTATAFVGDGSGITNQSNILFKTTLIAETNTITVPGLNGASDIEYEISLVVKVGSGGTGALFLSPNGINSGVPHTAQFLEANNTIVSSSIGAENNDGIQLGGLGNAGQFAYIKGTLRQVAVNGFKYFNGTSGFSDPSTGMYAVWTISGVTGNPTNTTSLVFKTAQANGFGIGTELIVSVKK